MGSAHKHTAAAHQDIVGVSRKRTGVMICLESSTSSFFVKHNFYLKEWQINQVWVFNRHFLKIKTNLFLQGKKLGQIVAFNVLLYKFFLKRFDKEDCIAIFNFPRKAHKNLCSSLRVKHFLAIVTDTGSSLSQRKTQEM